MAYSYYLTVKGSQQGAFEGEGGKSKGIEVLGYSLGASVARSSGSGQATGKRSYEPLSIAKKVGPASTQFFKALVTQEVLSDAELTIYKTAKNGKESAYFRITLHNAFVSEFEHEPGVAFSGDPSDTFEVETVSLVFQKISLTNVAAGTTVEDDLSHPA
jgi:type VI secretion system secreted protein Hcp